MQKKSDAKGIAFFASLSGVFFLKQNLLTFLSKIDFKALFLTVEQK
jgi:hypothetical protein